MTDDVLDRLRSSNPVPRDEVPAPPLETVMARLQAGAPEPARRRPSRLRGLLVPALGVAATIVVAVIALSVVGHRDRTTTTAPAHPVLPIPKLGMPGVVYVWGAAFPVDGHGLISVEQCSPCHAPTVQVWHTWAAIKSTPENGWQLVGAPLMVSPEFSGTRDGWSAGMTHAPNGGTVSAPYVTHDGGRTWTRIPLPSGASIATVSVAGGTAWVTASGADRRHVIVLRGPASGSTLARVGSLRFATGVAGSIVAGDAGTAYLDIGPLHAGRPESFVTHDAGRTWQRLPAKCAAGPDSTLSVDSPSSLWRLCPGPIATIGHSNDGGRHWHTFHVAAPGPPVGSPLQVRAGSPSTAWMLSNHGDVFRITGGGERSQQVWSVTRSQRTAVAGRPEVLTALDANTAYLTVLIAPVKHGRTNGTYLVVYKTHDGGRTWVSELVALPHR
jgi:photosystem II stability/assembly factor-like uncharacterized protein